MRSIRSARTAVAMTEYVIVVCLIAIAALAAVKVFGRTIERKTLGARNQIEIEVR